VRPRAASHARRVAERLAGKVYLPLDYPPTALAAPRYGYGRPAHDGLVAILARHEGTYRAALESFAALETDLLRIPRAAADPAEPFWDNYWFPVLDPIALYGLLRTREPERYVEIGSGMSTRFAARARRDGGLATRIVSIDPSPRAEIDLLCDEVVRQPLERSDLSIFDAVGPGDVVFLDGSHRVFMNSDACVFFVDVLPRLPANVIVGVHDVFLPYDYPPGWGDRYYSEQYLLAAALLAGATSIRPLLPSAYLTSTARFAESLRPFLGNPHFAASSVPWLVDVPPGVAFWFETGTAAL